MTVRNYRFNYTTTKSLSEEPLKARWRNAIAPDPDKPPISKTKIALYFGAIVLIAYLIGIQKPGTFQSKFAELMQFAKPEVRDERPRIPQKGDKWKSCNEARKVGTAPIYKNEPGYKLSFDGDNDGIACEPYFGD